MKKLIDNVWIFSILFLVLSFINIEFAYIGLLCALLPFILALFNKNQLYCAKYCPRGSFFKVVTRKFSTNDSIPPFFLSKLFKNIFYLIFVLFITLCISMVIQGFIPFSEAIFRMVLLTFIIGNAYGIAYKPNAWCTVCPVGNGAKFVNKKLYK